MNVPLNIAGLGLNSGLAAARDLGVNGLGLGKTMVHAVTAQITNIVSAVNDLASRGVTGVPLIDGVVNAVQAIALLPVTVGVAGVNGLIDTLTEAGSTAWTRITNGAAAAVTTWIGNGTDAGAVQAAINRIGAETLSPAAYADAASVIVSAVINTGKIAVGTAGSMASLPFSMGAGLTTTGADVIKTFNTSMASFAAGLMHAAGLPPFVSNLPHVMAGAVNGAITVAALAASTTLNGIAAAIDISNTLTGALPASQAVTLSLRAAAPSTPAERSVVVSDTESPTATAATLSAPQAAVTDDETALQEATPVEDALVDPAAQETANAAPEETEPTEETTTEGATEPEVTESHETITEVVESEEPPTDAGAKATTPATDAASATEDATSDEPAGRPNATATSGSKGSTSESERESIDEPKKSGGDNDSSGATAGGRHAPDRAGGVATVTAVASDCPDHAMPAGSAVTAD